MQVPIQPIVLLADSQLLYWRAEGEVSFMTRMRRWIEKPQPKASYLGASNGDDPAFYEIFTGAMQEVGIHECRHITAEPSASDWDFFAESDLVLLAGGDVRKGWRTFKKNGMKQGIIERYYGGALLIGVSAGAVQLGLYGFHEEGEGEEATCKIFEAFKLVPALVDVHQEPAWDRLKHNLPKVTEPTHGLGIPSGGGAILHPDLSLEPVRHPVAELVIEDDGLQTHLILPPESSGDDSLDETAETDLLDHAATLAAAADLVDVTPEPSGDA